MPRYKYVGTGDYLEGVPARDLEDAEYAALTESQQSDVRKCGLYEEDKPEQPAKPEKPANIAAPAAPEPTKEGGN